MKNIETVMAETMITAKDMLSKANSKNEFLAINGALLAVVQLHYVEYMGAEQTAQLFYRVADSLATLKD